LGTQILRERAPGAEPAARRRVDRAGQLAGDSSGRPGPSRCSGRLGFRSRDGGDKPGRVRMRRPLVDIVPRAHLNELARYMTPIRSAMYLTTARSWEMTM